MCRQCVQSYRIETLDYQLVDGVHIPEGSGPLQPLLQFKCDHCGDGDYCDDFGCDCHICGPDAIPAYGLFMRWSPRYPIVRFTSAGLQSEVKEPITK